MEAQNFYTWWTNTIKGNYIRDSEFELVLNRFDKQQENNNLNNTQK